MATDRDRLKDDPRKFDVYFPKQ